MTILAWFIVIGLPLIVLYVILFFCLDWEWKTALYWLLGGIGLVLGAVAFMFAIIWALSVLGS